jgi:hypothetical protein
MKIVLKNNPLLLLLLLITLDCTSQVNLSKTVSISVNELPNLSYVDSSGNGYERGLVGGMRMKVVFRNVDFKKYTGVVQVEGVIAVFNNEKDTVGLCCVDYFIAQPVSGYLTKIRKLGKTNSNQIGDASKPDGFFSFKTVLYRNDKLYFIGAGGKGLEEYNIGDACWGIK